MAVIDFFKSVQQNKATLGQRPYRYKFRTWWTRDVDRKNCGVLDWGFIEFGDIFIRL